MKNISIPSDTSERKLWPFLTLVVSTIFCLGVSIYFVQLNTFIVFQNLYYFPILIACVFYGRKGFFFSIILAFTYFILISLYAHDSQILFQAGIRVCIFILIAWVTSFLASIIKKTGEQLQQRETLFRGVFDTMPSGSAIYQVTNSDNREHNFIIEDLNKTALLYENKQKEDVIGRILSDLNPTTYSDSLIPKLDEVQKTGRMASFPSHITFGDGPTDYENSLFKLPTGEIVAIYTDVTEKKTD